MDGGRIGLFDFFDFFRFFRFSGFGFFLFSFFSLSFFFFFSVFFFRVSFFLFHHRSCACSLMQGGSKEWIEIHMYAPSLGLFLRFFFFFLPVRSSALRNDKHFFLFFLQPQAN